MDRSVVTRVEDWLWIGTPRRQDWPQQRRKVAGALCIGGQSTRVAGRAGALVVPILFPGEKEKGRAAQSAADPRRHRGQAAGSH